MEDIKIIYEDENILAVNKPAGLVVHGPDSLVDWLLKNYPEIKEVGEDASRPGIVHRLDKDTSGVILVAKNQKSFEYLKEQFSAPSLELKKEGRDLALGGQNRKIKKNYLVLVDGIIKENSGIINLPIAKSKNDFRKKEARPEVRLRGFEVGLQREAITEYKVLKKFDKFTLLEAYPKTGRTHQIRVHFKAIGHPIVGDKLYGKKEQILSRQFLHAKSLEFINLDGSRIKLEADLPDDLKNFLNMLD